jgi:serine/threonine-protein kinase
MSPTCPRCGSLLPLERLAVCPACLLDDEEEPDAEETRLMVGGGIVLEEEIGRGGMGIVYRARDPRLGRQVAVKVLPEALASREEFRLRFEREARALAMLSHPHIVAVHGFGEEDGRHYIVMEYVDGGSLEERLPVPPQRAVEMCLQICDALEYAHRKGIVHRDIKPANVLLDAAGRVKVGDFGLARLVSSNVRGWTVTSAGQAVGTPHFMAPEALRGEAPDPRMDIYSVGVLLYQMVTGRLPVGDFEPPPAPFEPIVRQALAHDPARRFASAEELRRRLQPLVSRTGPEPVELPPEEKNWLYAVALLQSIATAVALWAVLECLTPKTLTEAEVRSLVMHVVEELPDGRVYSRARFETWPVLSALAACVPAFGSYGLLRRHWRRSGLEVHEPDRPVGAALWVWRLGILAVVVFALRKLLEALGQVWAATYSPIVGGAIEVGALYFLWVSLLEAWRRKRPLRLEARLWIGFALALVPPVVEFGIFLVRGRP